MPSLPPHARLLGAGAMLTPARDLYARQQDALEAAARALPDGLHLGPDPADRPALVRSAVTAYLAVMCDRAQTDGEQTVWLADGVNGPVLLSDEGDALAYCDFHGIEAPTPLLVADRQTAAELIGQSA